MKYFAMLVLALCMSVYQKADAQCIQINSILVDACGDPEGFNEMVRFTVGNAPVNLNTMSVDWANPSNNWGGLIRNSTTAAKTSTLNAAIQAAGGCGLLIEPTGTTLPAGAKVILITSFNFDPSFNTFGALTENYYILYQNNPNTSAGHFANYDPNPTQTRTLSISFGSCSDTVTYFRSLLVDADGNPGTADGATVNFTDAGQASYVNYGCQAPVDPFSVSVAVSDSEICAGQTTQLTGTILGSSDFVWTTTGGTLTTPTQNQTSFTATATGTYTVTLTATNACGATVSDSAEITVTAAGVPDFPTALQLCSGDTAPILATTAPNGISGTWSPSAVSNTASGVYTFTPASDCATPVTLTVTVTNSITPDFETAMTLCGGTPAPALEPISANGISGVWSPAIIDNTANGTYVFTPNPGQCASTVTLVVSVADSIGPDFDDALTICAGEATPALATTSPNGITGVWSPAVIDNTAGGTYVFTPDEDHCAESHSLTVTVVSADWTIGQGCRNSRYFAYVQTEQDTAGWEFTWRDANGAVIGTEATFDVTAYAELNGFEQPIPATLNIESGACSFSESVMLMGFRCAIPKGVSANADGKNDAFNLTGLGVRELKIFNRYGMVVYEKTEYSNEWHGQNKDGNILPSGTYYYHLLQHSGESKTGWVYLLAN